ncbi:MAG: adenylosuccinate lyase, partial [Acidobacteriota bacterium]|nr:adenylosuccinate lyase [Acidobacteriota bacterium]
LALVDAGYSRDDAYRVVQSAARVAIEEQRNFREVVVSSSDVTLSSDELDQIFDLDRLLRHRHRILDALTWRA